MSGQLQFGLFFFGCLTTFPSHPYEDVIAATRLADRRGLAFVSTPERHFDPFGGAFPAPAVLAAALAAITETIQVRAGSVITPLHDVVRVVEDWSVVNHLSGDRCAISIGSGWSANDFVLAPDPSRFQRRKQQVLDDIETIRRLWAGHPETRHNLHGRNVEVRTFPRPLSASLPLWLTTGGHDDTFTHAGRLGVNVLTHLERQSIQQLAGRIDAYRAAREQAGHDPRAGIVTLMQHTRVLSRDEDFARTREELRDYLIAALRLEHTTVVSGGTTSGGSPMSILAASQHDVDAIVDLAVSRYMDEAALIGTREECLRRCRRLAAAGVDEVACLVDFMPTTTDVLAGVDAVAGLAEALHPGNLESHRSAMIGAFNTLRQQPD